MASITHNTDRDDVFRWKGDWNPSSGTFPSIASDGDAFAGDFGGGWTYRAVDYGIVDGITFQPDDLIVGLVSPPSTSVYAGEWQRIQDGANVAAALVTATTHGLTLPAEGVLPVYYDTGGGQWVQASATAANSVAEAVVVAIPDVDTLVMRTTGAIMVAAHGLTIGETYYLDNTLGGLTITAPERVQNLLLPVDVGTLLLDMATAVEPESTAGLFEDTFLSTDWVLNVSTYELTVTDAQLTAAGVASPSEVQSWADAVLDTPGGNLLLTTPDSTTLEATGDLVLGVTSVPDNRFSGKVFIYDDSIIQNPNSFNLAFDASLSWGAASGGFYTITIPQGTHNITEPRVVTVWAGPDGSSAFAITSVASVTVSAAGAVLLAVTDAPDNRFAGRVYIF